jgi:putative ubiquitin-RnfH superfamily antitoxin RatB of RatAB toxin-antitoxin module
MGSELPAFDRLVQDSAMTADEIGRLRKAYELALREIGVQDRDDPLTEKVAKEIIEVARTGLTDPAEISRLAVKRVGI